ncbi:MAG: transcriptional regulator [Clostridiales bacterium]|nr:transcriptional regulator [Clostridiales bacterium]MDY5468926.1 transcriptional regulator [Eubacteriales bacterium]
MNMEQSDRFDLTGRTFGRLTALKCVEGSRSRGIWECRCECGNTKRVSYHNLVHECTKSCGCSRGLAQAKDLTGQRFGRLTAIERTGEKKGTNFVWLCRCECGRDVKIPSNSLLSGNTRSCGCLQDETKRSGFHDIAGQRFGRLVAIEPMEKRSGGSVIWKCRCDCGSESEHAVKALVSGKAQSCGCSRLENDALQRTLHYIDGTCVEFLENMGKLRSDNTSGYPGLKWVRGKWQVRITFKKKVYYLGTYAAKEEAIRVRKEAEQRVFGEFLDWYYMTFPDKPTARKRKMDAQEGNLSAGQD